MSPDLKWPLGLLSLANIGTFYFGMLMSAFASEGPHSNAPKPLLYWAIIAIPIMSVLCPFIAVTAPWPFTTPVRRIILAAAPLIYVAGGIITLHLMALNALTASLS